VTVSLRLFARAREAAGCAHDEFESASLDDLLEAARVRYGPDFSAVLDTSRVWVNGDVAADGGETRLVAGDEVAVLPPVSGG
jgi:sulfur-carrier protein